MAREFQNHPIVEHALSKWALSREDDLQNQTGILERHIQPVLQLRHHAEAHPGSHHASRLDRVLGHRVGFCFFALGADLLRLSLRCDLSIG
jgi:hypothetical protein